MKRLFQWVLAATLVSGTMVLTSCKNDDNPAIPSQQEMEESLIGPSGVAW